MAGGRTGLGVLPPRCRFEFARVADTAADAFACLGRVKGAGPRPSVALSDSRRPGRSNAASARPSGAMRALLVRLSGSLTPSVHGDRPFNLGLAKTASGTSLYDVTLLAVSSRSRSSLTHELIRVCHDVQSHASSTVIGDASQAQTHCPAEAVNNTYTKMKKMSSSRVRPANAW